MPRVSIKDIAKAADVSHSTVSRALSESPLVSAETKTRIQRLAQEMGYTPNAQARGLVMGRTKTIGVVVTTISDPFIADIVQAVESTALDHGYSVILASSDAKREREIAAVEMLHSKRVDGVVVASSRIGALYQKHLERFDVPLVLINSLSEQSGPYTFSIRVDNRHGGHLATQHLLQRGHRRIAYVAAPGDRSDDMQRLAGYREALAEMGVGFDPALVVRGTGRAGGGRRAWPVLADFDDRPTAAFCYNDMTAIGLMHAARQAGLSLPEDLAVVGFDDIPFARYVYPPLTSIAQPMAEMGRRAMEMVLALLTDAAHESGPVTNLVIQGQLVVRESSGAPLAP